MRPNGRGGIVENNQKENENKQVEWKLIATNKPTEKGEYLVASKDEGPYGAGWNGKYFVLTQDGLEDYEDGGKADMQKCMSWISHWREMPEGPK
jgi:hypothetical protein